MWLQLWGWHVGHCCALGVVSMQSEVARNSIAQSSAPFGNNSIFNKAVNEIPFSTRLPVDRTVWGPGVQDAMEEQKGDEGQRLTSLFRTKGRLPSRAL